MTRPLENLKKSKATGGMTHPSRGRRAYEKDGYALEPIVGATAGRTFRTRGGAPRTGMVTADTANVAGASGRVTKVKILSVKNSPAKRDYERRGVITKGAVIETEAGEARVTSKPTDDGVVNAVLTKR